MIARFGIAAGFGVVTALFAFGAQAQLAGTYNGTQANGAAFSLTVTQKKTIFELSGLGVGITTTCPDSEKINEDTGIGFQPVPIPQPKFTFELLANPELYVKVAMLFDDATQSVSGTVTSFVPALDIFTKHPRKSETCVSTQTFTATLGAEAKMTGRKPRIVIY